MSKKEITGYVVWGKQGIHGFSDTGTSMGDKVLWLGGYGFRPALFKTKPQAKQAVKATEEYATYLGYRRTTHPLWFDHNITAVSLIKES